MKILALETSARAVSAAVSENGRILTSGYQDTGLTHSRTLMPIVEHILKNADLKPADMDAIAVAVGPGSFTGIRIGVAAAKGLALALDKPAIGVSTLAAMARNVAFADGLVVCAMDARRSQVYNATFSAEGGVLTRLTPDRAISLSELADELRGASALFQSPEQPHYCRRKHSRQQLHRPGRLRDLHQTAPESHGSAQRQRQRDRTGGAL